MNGSDRAVQKPIAAMLIYILRSIAVIGLLSLVIYTAATHIYRVGAELPKVAGDPLPQGTLDILGRSFRTTGPNVAVIAAQLPTQASLLAQTDFMRAFLYSSLPALLLLLLLPARLWRRMRSPTLAACSTTLGLVSAASFLAAVAKTRSQVPAEELRLHMLAAVIAALNVAGLAWFHLGDRWTDRLRRWTKLAFPLTDLLLPALVWSAYRTQKSAGMSFFRPLSILPPLALIVLPLILDPLPIDAPIDCDPRLRTVSRDPYQPPMPSRIGLLITTAEDNDIVTADPKRQWLFRAGIAPVLEIRSASDFRPVHRLAVPPFTTSIELDDASDKLYLYTLHHGVWELDLNTLDAVPETSKRPDDLIYSFMDRHMELQLQMNCWEVLDLQRQEVDLEHIGLIPGEPTPGQSIWEPEPRCPDPNGMVYIPEGEAWFRYEGDRWKAEGLTDHKVYVPAFCIDRFEYPNRLGELPRIEIGWFDCRRLCEREGKRLCTGEEWQKAYGGPDGLFYPYGNEFDPELCHTPKHRDSGGEAAAAPSGTYEGCGGPYGVYDMSGNLSEWTVELWQEGFCNRSLRGGGFNVNPSNSHMLDEQGLWKFKDYGQSIAAMHHHFPHSEGGTHDDGTRCCADPVK